MNLELLDGTAAAAAAPELEALLRDAVAGGASIGFLVPLADAEVADYWRGVAAAVAGGGKLLLVARDAGGRLLGAAQLALEARANGRHRAEVQKVMVFRSARGRGVGAGLMARLEAEARARARTLLFLDTSRGDAGAVQFYERLGYSLAGGIPDYAMDPDGTLSPNAIFYKRLT